MIWKSKIDLTTRVNIDDLVSPTELSYILANKLSYALAPEFRIGLFPQDLVNSIAYGMLQRGVQPELITKEFNERNYNTCTAFRSLKDALSVLDSAQTIIDLSGCSKPRFLSTYQSTVNALIKGGYKSEDVEKAIQIEIGCREDAKFQELLKNFRDKKYEDVKLLEGMSIFHALEAIAGKLGMEMGLTLDADIATYYERFKVASCIVSDFYFLGTIAIGVNEEAITSVAYVGGYIGKTYLAKNLPPQKKPALNESIITVIPPDEYLSLGIERDNSRGSFVRVDKSKIRFLGIEQDGLIREQTTADKLALDEYLSIRAEMEVKKE